MVIILMGVSGCGKTTVGRLLAEELGWIFCDADDYHPPENVDQMRSGVPLSEADRVPWLETLAGLVDDWLDRRQGAVLACSALSEQSRRMLCRGEGTVVVHLRGTAALISERLGRRRGHYMPAALLDSQFQALEEPEHATTVDIADPPEAIVAAIREKLSGVVPSLR